MKSYFLASNILIAVYLVYFSNHLVSCDKEDPFAEARFNGELYKSTDHFVSLFEYNYGLTNVLKNYLAAREPSNKKFYK